MSFGVIIGSRLAPPARGATTNTDTLFLACKAAGGPLDKAVLCRSLLDFVAAYGARTGLTVDAYDYLDCAFHEGLKRVWVGRYATNYTDAFALFDASKGPGQLAVIGTVPSSTVYADMQTHCLDSDGPTFLNRVALRDVTSGADVAAMETLGDAAPANDDVGATFGPWVTIPPPAGVYGATSRSVPYSAAIAGLIGRVDANGNPNRAAAGMDYPFQYVTGWDPVISDADRAGLFAHGVNAPSDVGNVLQNYGFQTNLAESEDNPFWQFNCSRARMWLKARSQVRGLPYVFRTIDGQGKLAGHLKSDIAEEFQALFNADGLYGDVPSDAYYIEVGEVINTVDEVAQGHLHAVGQARLSLHAKAVFIDLVVIPINGQVG